MHMCELTDCPLCLLEEQRFDVVAPVVDHDDVESLQKVQLGLAAVITGVTVLSKFVGGFASSEADLVCVWSARRHEAG